MDDRRLHEKQTSWLTPPATKGKNEASLPVMTDEQIARIRETILRLMSESRSIEHPYNAPTLKYYKMTEEEFQKAKQNGYIFAMFLGAFPAADSKTEGFAYDLLRLIQEKWLSIDDVVSYLPINLTLQRWNYLVMQYGQTKIGEVTFAVGKLTFPLYRKELITIMQSLGQQPLICSTVQGCLQMNMDELRRVADQIGLVRIPSVNPTPRTTPTTTRNGGSNEKEKLVQTPAISSGQPPTPTPTQVPPGVAIVVPVTENSSQGGSKNVGPPAAPSQQQDQLPAVPLSTGAAAVVPSYDGNAASSTQVLGVSQADSTNTIGRADVSVDNFSSDKTTSQAVIPYTRLSFVPIHAESANDSKATEQNIGQVTQSATTNLAATGRGESAKNQLPSPEMESQVDAVLKQVKDDLTLLEVDETQAGAAEIYRELDSPEVRQWLAKNLLPQSEGGAGRSPQHVQSVLLSDALDRLFSFGRSPRLASLPPEAVSV